MARLETRRWLGERARRTGTDQSSRPYQVYLPDRLRGRSFRLDGQVAAAVVDAELALARLDSPVSAPVGSDALARLLPLAEAAASSRIEGQKIGGRDLLRADAARRARRYGGEPKDITTKAVLANLDAMKWAVESVAPGDLITVDILLETHRLLMADSGLGQYGGFVRPGQNWIGGNGSSPCSATYVPPPECVPDLLEDLCAFCNDDSLPTVVTAAVAHAQFETIHPFVDGNGRVGRALVHMILRRRGLGRRGLPPVSLVLANRYRDYLDGLTAVRYVGEPDCQDAQDGINRWIALFAAAYSRAASDALCFEERIEAIKASWSERVGPARSNSTVALLIEALPAVPILTVLAASHLVGTSYKPVSEAVGRLVQVGVLSQISDGRRNRIFEASEIVDAFEAFARSSVESRG